MLGRLTSFCDPALLGCEVNFQFALLCWVGWWVHIIDELRADTCLIAAVILGLVCGEFDQSYCDLLFRVSDLNLSDLTIHYVIRLSPT